MKKKQIQFDILTLFPDIIRAYCDVSIIKRAQDKGAAKITAHQLRQFTTDKHHTTDETPYGGGAGMVLKAEPILRGVEKIVKKSQATTARRKVFILSAKGKPFTQKKAVEWSRKYDHIVLIAGRYEGIDERVKTILKAEEVSVGPYVLTDGELGAMVIVSAVTRLLPNVIRYESLQEESHWNDLLKDEEKTNDDQLLEYPHYTRPEVITWKGKKYRVPPVLLTGNHAKIKDWRNHRRKRSAHKP